MTGGSSGIGKATAFRVARAGAVTIIVARDARKLEATCEEAAAQGLSLIPYSADLAQAPQCEELVGKISAQNGAVDILINNAGRPSGGGIEKSSIGCMILST